MFSDSKEIDTAFAHLFWQENFQSSFATPSISNMDL